jgi:hypothetical protein
VIVWVNFWCQVARLYCIGEHLLLLCLCHPLFWMDYWNLLVKVLLCHLTRWQAVHLFSCLHPSEVSVTNAVVLVFLSLTIDCLIWIVDLY